MRRVGIPVLALAMVMSGATAAQAHIQVTPTTAAPGDAVQFELLVPNERDQATTEVSLQIPAGVLPFSFSNTPGWQRTLDKNSDGSIKVVRWRGQLRPETFVQFAFLASTPERAGAISWKAIQTYADGEEAAWIGPPDADEPAAVTEVTADAPRQNAGGESEGEGGASAPADTAAEPSGSSDSGGDDNRDWVAIALGGVGVLLGGAALLVALRRPKRAAS